MAMMHKVNYFNSFEKKLKSVGKKLNKKDLLSSNLATKHGYCTQHTVRSILIINLKQIKKWKLKKMNQKLKF